MTRHLFPGDLFLVEGVSNATLLGAGVTFSVWTARAGGTDVTSSCLADDNTSSLIAIADPDGKRPYFYGPDNATTLYIDAGIGERYPVYASPALLDAANIFTDKQQFNAGGFTLPAGGAGTYDIQVYLAPAIKLSPTVQTVGIYAQARVRDNLGGLVHDATLSELRLNNATNSGTGENAIEGSLVITGGANTLGKLNAVIANFHTEGTPTPTGTIDEVALFRASQVPSHGVPIPVGFTIGKVYGIYLDDQISATVATDNYSIYSAGRNFFDRIVPKDSTGAAVLILARSDTVAGTDLLSVKNSSNSTLFRINSSGQGGLGTSISNSLWFLNANNVGGGQVLLRVRANSSQTVDLAEYSESGGAIHMRVTTATSAIRANLIIGSSALATSATSGFVYLSSMPGAPAGTPTSYTGTVPIVIDTANNKLMAYIGGAWKGITLT